MTATPMKYVVRMCLECHGCLTINSLLLEYFTFYRVVIYIVGDWVGLVAVKLSILVFEAFGGRTLTTIYFDQL